MKTDKLLRVLTKNAPNRSGRALPLPKHQGEQSQTGKSAINKDSYWIDLPLGISVANPFDKRFWQAEWDRNTLGNLFGDVFRSPLEYQSTQDRLKELKKKAGGPLPMHQGLTGSEVENNGIPQEYLNDPYIGMRKYYDDAYAALDKYKNEQGEISPFNVARAWTKASLKNPGLLFRERRRLPLDWKEIESVEGNPYHKQSPIIRYDQNTTLKQWPTDMVTPKAKDYERYLKHIEKQKKKEERNNESVINEPVVSTPEVTQPVMDEEYVPQPVPTGRQQFESFTAAGGRMIDTNRNSPTFGKTIPISAGYVGGSKEEHEYRSKKTGGPTTDKLLRVLTRYQGPNVSEVGTGNVPQELIDQYNNLQQQINTGINAKQEFVKRLQGATSRLIDDGVVVENTDFVPQYIKDSPGAAFCISGSCYILNQAGDDFKYYDNTIAQDETLAGKTSRYLEQDEKYIERGDILQFKQGNKGRAYHAYLVNAIGEPDDKGWKDIEVAGSPGHGPLQYAKYRLSPDNKIYKEDSGSPMATQLLKKKTYGDIDVNEATRQRDALKKQIMEINPTYFDPPKATRYDVGFNPNQAFITKRTQSNPDIADELGEKTSMYAYEDRDYTGSYPDQIGLENAKIDEIINNVNNPEYKQKIMTDYNISNDEYNAAVRTMIGMYGAESKFGTDYGLKRGKLPEPKGLMMLNFLGWKDNSIGPFQLTVDQMGPTTRSILPNDKRDLFESLWNPVTASDYAMRFLAENIGYLRNKAKSAERENLTEENYLEYLPYVVNQQKWLARSDKKSKEKEGSILGEGTNKYKDAVNYYADQLGLDLLQTGLPANKYGGAKKTVRVRIKKPK